MVSSIFTSHHARPTLATTHKVRIGLGFIKAMMVPASKVRNERPHKVPNLMKNMLTFFSLSESRSTIDSPSSPVNRRKDS